MNKMVLIPKDKYDRLVNKEMGPTPNTPCHTRLNEDIILTFLNPRHKTRGQALLNHLSEVMDWNDKGEIIYQNNCVAGSHIADLLKACLHHYKDYENFEGMNTFCSILKDSNIPLTAISNAELRHKIDSSSKCPAKKEWVTL